MQVRSISEIFNEKLAQYASKDNPEGKLFSATGRKRAQEYKENVIDEYTGLYLLREIVEDLKNIPKDDGEGLKIRLGSSDKLRSRLAEGACECLGITKENIEHTIQAYISASAKSAGLYGGVPSKEILEPQVIHKLIVEKANEKLAVIKNDRPLKENETFKFYSNNML